MKLNFLTKSWRSAERSVQFLLVIVLIESVVTLGALYGWLKKDVVTRLVPPRMTVEAEISADSASKDYLISVALTAATLTGNVSPKNVTFVADAMGLITSPAIYPEVRRRLFALAMDPVFKDRGGSVTFTATGMDYEARTKTVFIKGELQSTTTAGPIGKGTPYVYEIQVAIENGWPQISKFDHYPGKQEKSQHWQSRNRRALEREAAELAADQRDEEAAKDPWFDDAVRFGAAGGSVEARDLMSDERRQNNEQGESK